MGAALDGLFSAMGSFINRMILITLAMGAGVGVVHILTILKFLPQIVD